MVSVLTRFGALLSRLIPEVLLALRCLAILISKTSLGPRCGSETRGFGLSLSLVARTLSFPDRLWPFEYAGHSMEARFSCSLFPPTLSSYGSEES